jgi:hypothetical protein
VQGDVCLNKPDPIAVTPALAFVRQPPSAPEGSTASGKALAEVARLSPDDALQRLSSTAVGLAPSQVEQQLRSVGPNRVARQARHTVLGELAARSINPLNILLLSLATASYQSSSRCSQRRCEILNDVTEPRNAKVSGFPSPRSLRSFAAKRPNSIKRARLFGAA